MTEPVSLTWWGHATTTIEIAGVRILTDPVLTRRLGHLSRVRGATPDRSARDADVVLVSHLHSDHLHVPSIRRVSDRAHVIGPRGSRTVIGGAASLVREVEPGDAVERSQLTIRAVPAAHDGRRHNRSNVSGSALGFLVEYGRVRIWFAGDTALFDTMATFAPVDLAVVPIGGWGPSLEPSQHMGPEHAAEAVRRTRARYAVPMHYSTFWPTGTRSVLRSSFERYFVEPAERFRTAVSATDAEAMIVPIGETVHLS